MVRVSYSHKVRTPALWWWYCWKCCGVHIKLCTHCGQISNQLKASVTTVGSSITDCISCECSHAIDNGRRIKTQCCRARGRGIMYILVDKEVNESNTMYDINFTKLKSQ